ncbi:MAG: hypothetical protein ACE5HE_15245 [Phycisphaerae bacterium]
MSSAYMRYADTEELRAAIDATGPDLTTNERGLFETVLDATSRALDDWCHRFFYQVTLTQTFTPTHGLFLVVPDLVSITTLKSDTVNDLSYDTTWSSDDYILQPQNAPYRDQGWPYTEVHASTATGATPRSFYLTPKSVQIVGVFGWPQVPDVIRNVTLLEAARTLKDFEAPTGVLASETLGTATIAPGLHPASKRMLQPYRRLAVRLPQ